MKSLRLLPLFLLLTACTHVTPPQVHNKHKSIKHKLPIVQTAPVQTTLSSEELTTLQAPAYYLNLAGQEIYPPARDHLLVQAARSYLHLEQADQAASLIAPLDPKTLELPDLIQYQFITAQLALIHNRPVDALQALQSLPDLSTQPVSTQITYQKLLAQSDEMFGQALEAIKVRLDLALLLNNPIEEKKNKRAIWRLSQNLSEETLTALAQDPSQPTLSGWATLTLIARHDQNNPSAFIQNLETWKQNFPNHPASTLLSDLLPASQSLLQFKAPLRIAVMLPKQGPLANQSEAIWYGILYSYYDMPAESRPVLSLYDSSQGKIADLYEQASKEGADFVLGPLTKDNVNAALKKATLITLSLNYSDERQSKLVYEFGLNLNQDAEQVAERIESNNQMKVLAITTDDPSNLAALQSFKQKFSALGGQTVEELVLTNHTDLSTALPAALQAHFDAIFLNLTATQALAVLPLIRASGNNTAPLYATSLVNTLKLTSNQLAELSGISFVDLPFLINPSDAMLKAQQHLAEVGGEDYKNYAKLYAVGMDAYHLVFELPHLKVFPDSTYAGSTGVLWLDAHQQIYHELIWGQFTPNGVIPLNSQTQGLLRDV